MNFLFKKVYYLVNRKNKKQNQACKLNEIIKLLEFFMVRDHEKTSKYQGSDPAFLEILPDSHSIFSPLSARGDNFPNFEKGRCKKKKWVPGAGFPIVGGMGGVHPIQRFFSKPPIKTNVHPPPTPIPT